MKGLGDLVARITKFFYIDRLAKRVAHLFGKKDCGCKRRQDKLNRWVPFKKKK